MARIVDFDGRQMTTAELRARVAAYYAGNDVASALDGGEQALAKEFVKRFRGDRGARTVIAQVAGIFEVSPEAVIGTVRTARLADARAVVAWILRERGYLLEEIARALSRDHSTVHHHITRVANSWELKQAAHEAVLA